MNKIPEMKMEYKSIRWGHQNTQDYRVAQFLNSGSPLSPYSALLNLDGVTRLAARVYTINAVLGYEGYPLITNTTKRTPNGKRYSEYRGAVPDSVLELL